jgi:general secretion pathway protein K
MADNINKNKAESLFRASGKPFKKVDDFLKDEALSGISVKKESLTVVSNHFLLSGQIDMGKNGLNFQSQLQRNPDGKVKVLSRMRRSAING